MCRGNVQGGASTSLRYSPSSPSGTQASSRTPQQRFEPSTTNHSHSQSFRRSTLSMLRAASSAWLAAARHDVKAAHAGMHALHDGHPSAHPHTQRQHLEDADHGLQPASVQSSPQGRENLASAANRHREKGQQGRHSRKGHSTKGHSSKHAPEKSADGARKAGGHVEHPSSLHDDLGTRRPSHAGPVQSPQRPDRQIREMHSLAGMARRRSSNNLHRDSCQSEKMSQQQADSASSSSASWSSVGASEHVEEAGFAASTHGGSRQGQLERSHVNEAGLHDRNASSHGTSTAALYRKDRNLDSHSQSAGGHGFAEHPRLLDQDSMARHMDGPPKQAIRGGEDGDSTTCMAAERTEEWVQEVSSEASGYASEWAAELAGLTPTSVQTPHAGNAHPDAWGEPRTMLRRTGKPKQALHEPSSKDHPDQAASKLNISDDRTGAAEPKHEQQRLKRVHPRTDASENPGPHIVWDRTSDPSSQALPGNHLHKPLIHEHSARHDEALRVGTSGRPTHTPARPTTAVDPAGQLSGLDSAHTPPQPIPAVDAAGAYSSLHSLADIGRRLSALRIGRQRATPSPLHESSSTLHSSSPAGLRMGVEFSTDPSSAYRDPSLAAGSRKMSPGPFNGMQMHAEARQSPRLASQNGRDRLARQAEAPAPSMGGVEEKLVTGKWDIHDHFPTRSFFTRSTSRSAERGKLATRSPAVAALHVKLVKGHSHDHVSCELETETVNRDMHLEHAESSKSFSTAHVRPEAHPRRLSRKSALHSPEAGSQEDHNSHGQQISMAHPTATSAAVASAHWQEDVARATMLPHAPANTSPALLDVRSKLESGRANGLHLSSLHPHPWGWRGSKHADPSALNASSPSPRALSSEGGRSQFTSPASSVAGSPAKLSVTAQQRQRRLRQRNADESLALDDHPSAAELDRGGMPSPVHEQRPQSQAKDPPRVGNAEDTAPLRHHREKRRDRVAASRLSRMSQSTFESEAALLAGRSGASGHENARQHAWQPEATSILEGRSGDSPRAFHRQATGSDSRTRHEAFTSEDAAHIGNHVHSERLRSQKLSPGSERRSSRGPSNQHAPGQQDGMHRALLPARYVESRPLLHLSSRSSKAQIYQRAVRHGSQISEIESVIPPTPMRLA